MSGIGFGLEKLLSTSSNTRKVPEQNSKILLRELDVETPNLAAAANEFQIAEMRKVLEQTMGVSDYLNNRPTPSENLGVLTKLDEVDAACDHGYYNAERIETKSNGDFMEGPPLDSSWRNADVVVPDSLDTTIFDREMRVNQDMLEQRRKIDRIMAEPSSGETVESDIRRRSGIQESPSVEIFDDVLLTEIPKVGLKQRCAIAMSSLLNKYLEEYVQERYNGSIPEHGVIDAVQEFTEICEKVSVGYYQNVLE